jgi:hypothetical protein
MTTRRGPGRPASGKDPRELARERTRAYRERREAAYFDLARAFLEAHAALPPDLRESDLIARGHEIALNIVSGSSNSR